MSEPTMPGWTVTLAGAEQALLETLASDLARYARPGDLIALEGDLGAGKSTFARAFLRARSANPALEVPSPTYTLVQPYDLAVPVAHADLYRLGDESEIDELGLDEWLETGIVLVEWPERAPSLLHRATLAITLSGTGQHRDITLTGDHGRASRLMRSAAIRYFLEAAGLSLAGREPLGADASVRSYERILPHPEDRLQPSHGLLLMDAPRQPDGPPIRDGKPYSRIAHLAEDVNAFAAIDHVLRSEGFRAPAILAQDLDAGLLLLEHLGEQVIIDGQRRPIAERYCASARLLAHLHHVRWPETVSGHGGPDHAIPRYDRQAMRIEVALLADWYWPRRLGRKPTDAETTAYGSAWDTVLDQLDSAETSLVLRDYHSPNIIWRPDHDGHDRIGLIDFQDAVIGPSAYDVASLGRDARIDVPDELEAAVRDSYCAERLARDPGFDRAAFERDYAVMAAQRNAKILGIFVRLDERDGKPAYLAHLPRIERYFAASLRHPALEPVARCLAASGLSFGLRS